MHNCLQISNAQLQDIKQVSKICNFIGLIWRDLAFFLLSNIRIYAVHNADVRHQVFPRDTLHSRK